MKYEDLKKFLRRLIYDTRTNQFLHLNDFLALITILSIVNFVLETMPQLSEYHQVFTVLEWTFVSIFILEYITRLIATNHIFKYMFGFYGLIDLMSFLPTLIGLGNYSFLKSVRVIRILNLLRLVRIAKIRRLDVEEVEESMSVLVLNVLIYFSTLSLALLFVGGGIYFFEAAATPSIDSIPAGMVWALTVFLDGMSFVYPQTTGGLIMLGVARFIGLALFGVLIGILGNVMKHYLYNNGVRRKSLLME